MSAAVETQNEEIEGEDTVTGDAGSDTVEANPLGMSDDDFLKQAPPVALVAAKEDKAATAGAEEGAGSGEEGAGGENTPQTAGSEAAAGDGGKPAPKAVEGTTDKTEKTDPAEKPADTAVGTDGKPVEKQPATAEKTAEVDYAAAGKALLAPFKANGREIRVETVEDARALMQMGANYNKKMAGLKPSLKILKLLENNGLLSEEKLGFLIDVSKKDPAAINKLVKESGISPMEIDPEKAGEYRATAHRVDDREVDLDAVLDDIKDSSSYTKTLGVAQAWDADSKKVIGDQPAVLRVINDHIESGIYDLIVAEVERERTFGRLQGVSDIAAYRQVGDAIQARGGFNHLFKPSATAGATEQGQASEAGKVVEPKPKKVDDESRNDKRRAMGSPKPAAPSGSTAGDFNPLAMSDADFLKQAVPKFR